ncbi:hypothetical protein Hanom_Chr06g00486411 [Helianthus anomalus]
METYKPTFLSNIPTTSPKSVLENVEAPNVHSDDIKAPTDHHHHRHPQSDDVAVAPLKPITNVIKVTSPLILKEYGSNHRVEAQKNTCVTPTNSLKHNVDIDGLFPPLTPPRSPGLDTSDDENLEVVFAAKPKQSKPVEKATSKRPRNNEAEDSAKREAMRMCKRMPGARGDLLMAALSAKSENSLVRKSKKMVSSPRKNISKSHERFNSVKRNLGRFSLT